MRALDVLLLVAAGLLVLAGPVMALQEFVAFDEAAGRFDRTGVDSLDTSHRGLARFVAPVLVVVVDVLATLQLVRINRKRVVRSVSRRPGLVMLVGVTLLDVAYVLDLAWGFDSHPLLRMLTTPWLYLVAGILVAGSAHRLASLEDTLAPLPIARQQRV